YGISAVKFRKPYATQLLRSKSHVNLRTVIITEDSTVILRRCNNSEILRRNLTQNLQNRKFTQSYTLKNFLMWDKVSIRVFLSSFFQELRNPGIFQITPYGSI